MIKDILDLYLFDITDKETVNEDNFYNMYVAELEIKKSLPTKIVVQPDGTITNIEGETKSLKMINDNLVKTIINNNNIIEKLNELNNQFENV